ncbi:AbfB domain-containing protein, partial [Kitasatospora sp. NPDC093558]|uniref:AbfB domain-containing protein n=1 Tax=Kitasatospora sp. NPDC093558 TaxID=3155201 RepID=UPI003417FBEB
MSGHSDGRRSPARNRASLAGSGCVSFESADMPGSYLRHYAFQLLLQPNAGTSQFAADATFCAQPGNSGTGYSLKSFNFPERYVRHYRFAGYVASTAAPTPGTALRRGPRTPAGSSPSPGADQQPPCRGS